MLEIKHPGLIVIDINMPWLTGIELSLRVRLWSNIPILLLTTWGARQNKVRAFDPGSENYLTDSLDKMEVMVLVQNAVGSG